MDIPIHASLEMLLTQRPFREAKSNPTGDGMPAVPGASDVDRGEARLGVWRMLRPILLALFIATTSVKAEAPGGRNADWRLPPPPFSFEFLRHRGIPSGAVESGLLTTRHPRVTFTNQPTKALTAGVYRVTPESGEHTLVLPMQPHDSLWRVRHESDSSLLALIRTPALEGDGFSTCFKERGLFALFDWHYFCGSVYDSKVMRLGAAGVAVPVLRRYERREVVFDAVAGAGDEGDLYFIVQGEHSLRVERVALDGRVLWATPLGPAGSGASLAREDGMVDVILASTTDGAREGFYEDGPIKLVTLDPRGKVVAVEDSGVLAPGASRSLNGSASLTVVSESADELIVKYSAHVFRGSFTDHFFLFARYDRATRRVSVASSEPVDLDGLEALSGCYQSGTVADGVAIVGCAVEGQYHIRLRDLRDEDDRWHQWQLPPPCEAEGPPFRDLLWFESDGDQVVYVEQVRERYERPTCREVFGLDPRLALAEAMR